MVESVWWFSGPHRFGSPSILMMTPGIFSAEAMCDTPVQLESTALACFKRSANAPNEVFPAVIMGLWRMDRDTSITRGISSAVPVMTMSYPNAAQ